MLSGPNKNAGRRVLFHHLLVERAIHNRRKCLFRRRVTISAQTAVGNRKYRQAGLARRNVPFAEDAQFLVFDAEQIGSIHGLGGTQQKRAFGIQRVME